VSAVLDTHTVLWYLEDSQDLSANARSAIEERISAGHSVYVSAISLVETVYLAERGRLTLTALERLESALRQAGSGLLVAPIDIEVVSALQKISRDLVPDMPDRIIAGTALYLGVPLITRDRRLQTAGLNTVW
jgi:PIN domain nuclease of toxin-antitoxin system